MQLRGISGPGNKLYLGPNILLEAPDLCLYELEMADGGILEFVWYILVSAHYNNIYIFCCSVRTLLAYTHDKFF